MFRLSRSQHASFLFVSGLCLAVGLSVALDGGLRHRMLAGTVVGDMAQQIALAEKAPRSLNPADVAAAKRAWAYVSANTQPQTGFVNSVAGFPSTTLWDQGSYLLGLVAAKELLIVEDTEFHRRTRQLLDSLSKIPLFADKLPNKAYNTISLDMVDYENQTQADGIGWSAIDVSRMLMALRALEKSQPEYGETIRQLLSRWDLNAMTRNGEMLSASHVDGETQNLQEGRLGYEQYAARAAALWGLDVTQAVSGRRALEWVDINGVEIPADTRRATTFQAITPILSEPYVLQGLELGFDTEARIMAERVYRAQEARYQQTGVATMVSEDHLNSEPYFLYSSVYANGEPWGVVTEAGEFRNELRTLSVKAVFSWDALYETQYTRLLRTRIEGIGEAEKGWPAGIYESDGRLNDVYTLNTNAIILEAIHYKKNGPLWRYR